MKRRHVAILAADVAGYSRLMAKDEEGTTHRLRKLRNVIAARVGENQGRIFSETGDGFVVEFPHPLPALCCAMTIQQDTRTLNDGLPKDQKMLLRIGIHSANVIVERKNLLGTGVILASRIESVAEPGRIFLSAAVYDEVKKSSPLAFEFLGSRSLKNIADKTPLYAIRL